MVLFKNDLWLFNRYLVFMNDELIFSYLKCICELSCFYCMVMFDWWFFVNLDLF